LAPRAEELNTSQRVRNVHAQSAAQKITVFAIPQTPARACVRTPLDAGCSLDDVCHGRVRTFVAQDEYDGGDLFSCICICICISVGTAERHEPDKNKSVDGLMGHATNEPHNQRRRPTFGDAQSLALFRDLMILTSEHGQCFVWQT